MTCTEVQRTLVKSPPELWAELSDPDALARHLAELGEIRVTAVVPESAIRWEAPAAAGSVELNPSGWGTKVTLSATRRATEGESAPTPTPATPPQPASPPQPTSPPQSVHAPQPEPAHAEILGRAVAPAAPGPAHALEPSTAAGRAAQPEPSRQLQAHQPMPDEQPHEPDEHDEPEEPDSAPLSVPAHPAPEPTRRGFFARLFGWRNHEPSEPVGGANGNELWDSASPGEHGPGVREQSIAEEPHPKPGMPSALEALQARYGQAESTPVGAMEASPPAPEGPSGISAELRAAEERGPAVDPGPSENQRPSEDPGPGEDPRPGEDLGPSVEPIAEQVIPAPSDEQMRAILTGVLDRLGAAHHRPFSRA